MFEYFKDFLKYNEKLEYFYNRVRQFLKIFKVLKKLKTMEV